MNKPQNADVVVIPSTLDGAERQRAKRANKHHVVLKGKNDEDIIHEALEGREKGNFFSISEGAWQRIFGGKHG